MLLLSNLGGLHFRLAQNRKGLTYQSNKRSLKYQKSDFKMPNSSNSENDFFDNFLNENKEFLLSNGEISLRKNTY
jgi:hypothetical protein